MSKVRSLALIQPLRLGSVLNGGFGAPAVRNYHFDLLNLKIGYTTTVENHPDSEKLYVSQIKLDQAGRVKQICSGIRDYVSRESLQGSLVVVVDNMKKCKLRGQISEGMIICGESASENLVSPFTLAKFDSSLIGKTVVLESASGPASEPTTRRIKSQEWEDISSRMKVGEGGRITYRDENTMAETYLSVYDTDGEPVPVIVKGLPAGSAVK
ncbi:hypothetical protein HG536_0D04850 [Torulaspora globosa]|uniref:tRNA-binding domain-containing protein n=1 Tax=Torulaspora globosa TaxID=48254 RepID=A0A7G3ZHH7_9SACH|nr:uncharacterized protein HG536_0D04850 [Torulaspora globosa]QLL32963.1 hypothetical protein HG536_0D04850 [Torulaspora globosa]